MKAPKEIRQWINRRRRASGKTNGVIPWLWEHPEMERKMANQKGCKMREGYGLGIEGWSL